MKSDKNRWPTVLTFRLVSEVGQGWIVNTKMRSCFTRS